MADVPEKLLTRLMEARRRHHLPSQIRPQSHAFLTQVLGLLFPHFAPNVGCTELTVREELIDLEQQLRRLERSIGSMVEGMPSNLVDTFFAQLDTVQETLQHDAQAIYEGDPAARSVDEVILTYPGFFAISVYRVAHVLHGLKMPLLPRLLTELAHEKTGIDLHPGASIGRRFCIDHGTGIVVGETSVLGAGVKLYQGVTLGALTVEKSLAGNKRHPTIEDEVVIYAGATILGGNTVVGHHSIIAGNAFLTTTVPSYSVVTRQNDVRPRKPNGSMEDIEFII
ncbi:MAG: serine acetyltransferase [Archangium sp.]|nr:serine acetyltransferase [Archangium sp.]